MKARQIQKRNVIGDTYHLHSSHFLFKITGNTAKWRMVDGSTSWAPTNWGLDVIRSNPSLTESNLKENYPKAYP